MTLIQVRPDKGLKRQSVTLTSNIAEVIMMGLYLQSPTGHQGVVPKFWGSFALYFIFLVPYCNENCFNKFTVYTIKEPISCSGFLKFFLHMADISDICIAGRNFVTS
jgi:hypothetical protein